MKIEIKFEINNLLRHKFETENERLNVVYEVMEIKTQTCYAGSQVFYDCRPIHLMKEFKSDGKWAVCPGFATGYERSTTKWVTFREDELIEAPKEMVDIILNHNQ